MFCISNFCRVLNVVCFLLGNSPASDAGELPRRKHTTFRTQRKFEIKTNSPLWGGNCNTHSIIWKTLNQKKIQLPGNYPEESKQHSEHGKSFKSRIIHLYGEETARHVRLFEKLRIKKNSLAGELPRRMHTTRKMLIYTDTEIK